MPKTEGRRPASTAGPRWDNMYGKDTMAEMTPRQRRRHLKKVRRYGTLSERAPSERRRVMSRRLFNRKVQAEKK